MCHTTDVALRPVRLCAADVRLTNVHGAVHVGAALLENPELDKYAGRVSESVEGRWTIAAIEESVPVPVLSDALYERFSSRARAEFANRMLSALHLEFGGHEDGRRLRRAGPE